MKNLERISIAIALSIALTMGALSVVRADEIGSQSESSNLTNSDGTRVVSSETIKSTDEKGNVIEKRIVKKIRARTVVDFEEASIEGKVKKPNAAYLLHGADLEFKHLYRVKHNQKERILGSYEYLR